MSWGHQKFGEPEVLVTLAIKVLYFSWKCENLGRLGQRPWSDLGRWKPTHRSVTFIVCVRLRIGDYIALPDAYQSRRRFRVGYPKGELGGLYLRVRSECEWVLTSLNECVRDYRTAVKSVNNAVWVSVIIVCGCARVAWMCECRYCTCVHFLFGCEHLWTWLILHDVYLSQQRVHINIPTQTHSHTIIS